MNYTIEDDWEKHKSKYCDKNKVKTQGKMTCRTRKKIHFRI